ncbi:MAG: hypothetical protein Q4D94_14025 [Bacillota bacterium]|nr:hypothetical protein [Bacillota bacterium]
MENQQKGPDEGFDENIIKQERFRAEKLYRFSLYVVQSMRKEGLISCEEYRQIDTILLEKYRPILGILLSGRYFI